jgi:hypothetical protein
MAFPLQNNMSTGMNPLLQLLEAGSDCCNTSEHTKMEVPAAGRQALAITWTLILGLDVCKIVLIH